MSVQDEHELRDRLSALLGSVEPRPAPVTRVVRRGKGIRRRRWISVAAGLAVIVTGVALIPGVLQSHRVAPMTELHYKVTVRHLGPAARAGVIGAGATNGHRWQVRLSGRPGNPTIVASGVPLIAASPVPVGWPASLEGDGGPDRRSNVLLAGTVSDRVTRLDLSLPNGELLRLTPVSWGGNRWVAVELPPNVRVVRAVAYAGARELAYAVPFGTITFATWWRPGQIPPPRVSKLIGAGRTNGKAWNDRAEIGPWGYCYTSSNGTACFPAAGNPQLVPAGRVIGGMTCGPLSGGNTSTGPISGLIAAASDVRRVVLNYSDGSTGTFPAVEAGGNWLVGYAIPAHLSVVSSTEYGAAGQVVGHTSGATWEC